MLGASFNDRHPAASSRWRALGLLALLLLLGSRPVAAQFFTAADTPAPENTIPMVEPALPTDPTAPATARPDPAATPTITLIPAPPLNPLEPPPVPRPSVPSGTGALPGGILPGGILPADPLAAPPVPANPASPVDLRENTTNNIGTARRFQYLLAATVGATFDDNIFLEPFGKRGDLYFTIQPTIVLGLGGGLGSGPQDNTLRFSYSPQVLLYVDNTDLNTVQHFVSLSGSYHLPRLTLTGNQDVQILNSTDVGNPHPAIAGTIPASGGGAGTVDPNTGTVINTPNSNLNLDVGQRTRLNLYSTTLAANYYVSDKVSYDLSGQLSISDYAGDLLSSSTVTGNGFFNYSPTGKTTLGAGVTVGELFAERPSPDQTFEQGNLRLSYVPGSKLIFSGQVGFEFRQSSELSDTKVTPIFEVSASYAPFDGTSFALSGNRRVQASAVLGGQNYEITGFSLAANQRFFQRAYVRLNVGYTHTDYRAEVNNLAAARSDDYFFVQPGVDITLREKIVLGFFYNHRESTSTQGLRNFSDNQVGVRLSGSY